MNAANVLLREAFPDVKGFEETLFRQKPSLRNKSKCVSANIFHHSNPEHFVATVYKTNNIVDFMDFLIPGGKPCDEVPRY